MVKFGIGQSMRRAEDPRLLTGGGRYTDDVRLSRQAVAVFVRSPHAHASIRSIDVGAAAVAPGVIGVVTGADLERDGVGHILCKARVSNHDGSPQVAPSRPALAVGRVRHVGDPVAAIIAETADAGRDAAELVSVDYAPLPAVASMTAAIEPGAPLIWDEAPNNICFDWTLGDRAACDAAFARAARVVRLDLVNNRLAPTPMEGRACNAAVDPSDGRMTLYVASQGVHMIRGQLANDIFRIPPTAIRVVTPDVGGGFGMKSFLYPEYVACLYAARRFERPVRWTSDRGEAFLSDDHGRDNLTKAELALDAENRFLAIRVDTLANLGSYLSNYGPFVPTEAGNRMLPGLYTIGAAHARVRGIFTNTQPVDAYRGAGRPEAAYVIERIVDAAAREIGIDPVALRRINFIKPDQLPYRTATGLTYDSGDFQRNLADALAAADLAGMPERRAEAAGRGRLRGVGIATYVEACSGGPAESARVRIARSGEVTLLIGTQTNGQGHETAYRQVLAEFLGLAPERITVVQGDTDLIATGTGTGGSRSIPVGSAAINGTALKIRDKALPLAAEMLEAATQDVAWEDGAFVVVGTDRKVTIEEVAARSAEEIAFDEIEAWKPPSNTYPNGAHICEVEIDPETGACAIVRYTVVDDFGTVLNPMMLEGQVHGGIGQGVGQALLEEAVFDAETAQLLTGSFMDYAMPRADSLPFVDFRYNVVPSTTNALGMKGAGEAGSIGAPPAIINAVVDALAPLGIRHIDMPATPRKIWEAIQAARPRAAAE